jgi:translation initiation factor RLI1
MQDLSGGELQRFAIAVVAVQKADVYMSAPHAFLALLVQKYLLTSTKVRMLTYACASGSMSRPYADVC